MTFSFKGNRAVAARRARALLTALASPLELPPRRQADGRAAASARSSAAAARASSSPTWKAAARAFGLRCERPRRDHRDRVGPRLQHGPVVGGRDRLDRSSCPRTWKMWGMDADGDGKASPYNSRRRDLLDRALPARLRRAAQLPQGALRLQPRDLVREQGPRAVQGVPLAAHVDSRAVLLVVDVGNTQTHFGTFAGDRARRALALRDDPDLDRRRARRRAAQPARAARAGLRRPRRVDRLLDRPAARARVARDGRALPRPRDARRRAGAEDRDGDPLRQPARDRRRPARQRGRDPRALRRRRRSASTSAPR